MLNMRCAVSESDAVRAYIRTLRAGQSISQDAVADAMGMAHRTDQAWELGETKDIKVPLVVRAIKFLGGAFDHLGQLDGASEAEAEHIASEWIKLTPDQKSQVSRIESKFRRAIELGENDPVKLEQVVARLRTDVQTDPIVLDMVMAYLDGRRSPR